MNFIKNNLANALTLGNLFCGSIAVIHIINHDYHIAAVCLVLSLVLDFFDGFVYLPYKVDDFLTFMYGNYKEPKKDTSIENYDNRVVQKKSNLKSFDVRKRVI